MLQIDHIYEFFYYNIFKDFDFFYLKNGYPNTVDISISDITIFTPRLGLDNKIFFYDQEPLLETISNRYIEMFKYPEGYTAEELFELNSKKKLPYGIKETPAEVINYYQNNTDKLYPKNKVLVTSEKSALLEKYKCNLLYYFFHGFAALDWYRGHYALNYNKLIIKPYNYDFIAFNRIITDDRSYRIYFVSLLKEKKLLNHGQVSFNVTDNLFDDWRDETCNPNTKLSESARLHIEKNLTGIDKLIIDSPELPGSASADIPREINALWQIVTETVFYYDKLHLTEKIFKPIVSKQPFMLLAAPGNLAYLRSYGFKTFDSVIDESYDLIQDNDLRIEAVVRQLYWYCNLSPDEKIDIIKQVEPIIQHNFHHFYGEFRHIITRELLDNIKTLFQSIGYDDSHINYTNIHHALTH